MYCVVISNLYEAAHSSGNSVELPVRRPREKKIGFLEETDNVGTDP